MAHIAHPGYAGHPGHPGHGHFRHDRFFYGLGDYAYGYDYDYGYAGDCGYYRHRARETGSAYWRRRYRECLYG